VHKQIYVNGSSFSYGYGLDKKEFLEKLNQVNSEYIDFNEPQEKLNDWRKNNCWPGILQTLSGMNVINESLYGGSFSRVMRMTFDYINNQEKPEETFYILEIPNADRYDFWNPRLNKFIRASGGTLSDDEPFNMYEEKVIIGLYTHFHDWTVAWRREMMNFIFFCSYLKSLNLDFIIIPTEQFHATLKKNKDSDELSHWGERSFFDSVQTTIKNFDLNLIKFKIEKCPFGNTLEENYTEYPLYEQYTNNLLVFSDEWKLKFRDETNGILEDDHFSLLGNQKIAQNVYEYFKFYNEVKNV